MPKFESYSFTRLYKDENLEFFFVIGVNDMENFDEYWDGRNLETLGYTVLFIDFETKKQKNFIYLMDDESREYTKAIKHTKQFIQQMSLSEELSDRENFEIVKTNIKKRVLSHPYNDFIKMVVKNEIPEFDSK